MSKKGGGWKSKKDTSKSNTVKYCKKCMDTSFELWNRKVVAYRTKVKTTYEKTGKCCRCGEQLG